jgi:transcriptional regulator with XRE-family HTH domain
MKLGEKIKQVSENKGFTPSDLASKLGKSTTAIYDIFRKDKLSTDILEDISEKLGIPITYFFEDKIQLLDISNTEKIQVPVLPVYAFASFYSGVLPNDVEYRLIEKRKDVKYDKCTAIVKIMGDSMYPNFRSNSEVLCNLVSDGNWEYTRGACVVSLKTDMVVFKRIKSNSEKILSLISDNEQGGEMEVQISDVFAIWKAEYINYQPAE